MLFSIEPERWRVSYFSDVTKQINSHFFSKRVECFFPNSGETPSLKQCQEILSPSQYFYYTVRCPLKAILTQDFINKHIRTKGTHRFYALSCPEECSNSNVSGALYSGRECQSLANRFAILPSGKLVLSLDRETYQQLGLEGSSPKYEKFGNNKDGERRIVIDLSAPSFVPGKPLHDRVLWCLSPERTTEVAFHCCFINTSSGTSEEITFDEGITAERKALVVREETIGEVLQPTAQSIKRVPSIASKRQQSDVKSLHLWAGLLAVRSDPVVNYRRHELGDFISIGDAKTVRGDGYLTRTGDETVEYTRIPARCVVAKGFVPDTIVARLVREMPNKGEEEWGSVMSWGFPNALVSWGDGCEHSDFLGGDNNMIVFTGTEKPFGMCVISPHDTF